MSKTLISILLFLIIVANMLIYERVFSPRPLQVSVLSVGKGDAVLVRSPRSKSVLIDMGPDASILRAVGQLLPEWRRGIDDVILTSPSASASGGLSALKSRYQIGSVTTLPIAGRGSAEVRKALRITYGAASIVADENRTPLSGLPVSDLLISSSTVPRTYETDGQTVW